MNRLWKIVMMCFFAWHTYAGMLYAQNEEDKFNRKSVIKEINANMKSANYAKADELVRNAMNKYKKAANDAEFCCLGMNAKYGLALEENKKMYLSSNPDTAKYFNYIYGIYEYGLKCDSIESCPNEKGKIVHKHKSDISSKFIQFRRNLRSAGKYFYKKKNYADAYKFIDLYMGVMSNPLAQEEKKRGDDEGEKKGKTMFEDSVAMAQIAVLAGYASERYDNAVKYFIFALHDSTTRAEFLEIGCKAYLELKDTANYVKALKYGYDKYPEAEYFYISLIKAYNEKKDYLSAVNLTREMLQRFPEDRKYWFIKGQEELNLAEADSAIVSFGKAIEIKGDDAESYSNIGDLYVVKARKLYDDINMDINDSKYKELKNEVKALYSKACDHYEKAKEFAPDNSLLWLAGLKECYFKLNKGKELKSLEKLK